eukprot:comp9219_c0_seq1/m.4359 comp9219_c0_seq1/g.4359  ORF comp9219_c0_seq1/g.4359 comp9219_c0_seq1/m.4359 type:complete len:277 (-) comp9219_c0_seq1:416-1246(-)
MSWQLLCLQATVDRWFAGRRANFSQFFKLEASFLPKTKNNAPTHTSIAQHSTMADLDRPLDEIVKESKQSRRGRGRGRGAATAATGRGGGKAPASGGSGGPIRKTRGRTAARPAPYQTEKPKPAPKLTSTKLLVENLHQKVNDADIKELFSQVGTVRKTAVHYNAQGKSIGTAEVHYARPEDVAKAIKEYNGLTLDGKPMKLSVVAQPTSDVLDRVAAPKKAPARAAAPARGAAASGRGRGAARGGRGGRGGARAPKAAPKTQADLDKELDQYHKV